MYGDSKGDHVIVSVNYSQPPIIWYAAIQVAEQPAAEGLTKQYCVLVVHIGSKIR